MASHLPKRVIRPFGTRSEVPRNAQFLSTISDDGGVTHFFLVDERDNTAPKSLVDDSAATQRDLMEADTSQWLCGRNGGPWFRGQRAYCTQCAEPMPDTLYDAYMHLNSHKAWTDKWGIYDGK